MNAVVKPDARAARGSKAEHQESPRRDRPARATRTRSYEPSAGPLDRYFGELSELPMLDAKQELALAREIEALALAHWRALLSYRPALDVLARELATHLPEHRSKLRALCRLSQARGNRALRHGTRDPRWPRAVSAAAGELQALRCRQLALRAADGAVREALAGDRRAQAYLARVARARDAEHRAKGRFVTANLRLVISMARRYGRNQMPLSDLIQEGNLGLMQAVERFDYRRGNRFSTYASWWIRHHLNRALSDKARVVRIPVHALDDMARIARLQRVSSAKTGASLSTQVLASELGLSEEKLELLRASGRAKHPTSLDHDLGDERDQTLHDMLAAPQSSEPDEALDLVSWRAKLERLLAELPEREATILRLRFGLHGAEPLTLSEVGERYNLTRERIRQLQEQALAKLRDALRRDRRPDDDEAA